MYACMYVCIYACIQIIYKLIQIEAKSHEVYYTRKVTVAYLINATQKAHRHANGGELSVSISFSCHIEY